MFHWLRRTLSSREPMSPTDSMPTTSAPINVPKLTVTISIGNGKRAVAFQSPALLQLWSEVQELSHSDHPFLDPWYSPSSQMPCADFTLWIAGRIAANDWPSVWELLDFIASGNEIAALRRSLQSYDFSEFIDADDALLFELKAAAILAYRIGWMGHEENRLSLIEEIYQHCLASYPFTIRQSALPHLLEGGNSLIRKRNREGVHFDEALLTPDRLMSYPEPSSAGETLRRFPPTFAACIMLSMRRGTSIPGTIQPRFHGEYGLRQYGLAEKQNRDFFVQCGFFEPASDLHALARSLTKDVLFEIAAMDGIQVTKSWKKERILSLLLETENARAAISARAATGFVQYRAGMSTPFNAWRARVIAVQPLARCLACA